MSDRKHAERAMEAAEHAAKEAMRARDEKRWDDKDGTDAWATAAQEHGEAAIETIDELDPKEQDTELQDWRERAEVAMEEAAEADNDEANPNYYPN